jgi:hypothetical protein
VQKDVQATEIKQKTSNIKDMLSCTYLGIAVKSDLEF